ELTLQKALVPLTLALLAWVRGSPGHGAWPATHMLVAFAVSVASGLLVFAVPEALWGASPGKGVFRLRVRTGTTGDRPGLGRSALRSLGFYACKDGGGLLAGLLLLLLLGGGVGFWSGPSDSPAARERALPVAVAFLAVLLVPLLGTAVGLGLMACSMRRR